MCCFMARSYRCAWQGLSCGFCRPKVEGCPADVPLRLNKLSPRQDLQDQPTMLAQQVPTMLLGDTLLGVLQTANPAVKMTACL